MIKLTKEAVIAEMNVLLQQRDPRARFDPNALAIGALVEVFCEKINAAASMVEGARGLIERIRRAWSEETAAPDTYDQRNPACGQCAVTALVVQDYLGGDLLRAEVAGGSHYWNRIPWMGELDLTRDQYPPTLQLPRGVVVPRSRLLEGERAIAARTPERYAALARAVAKT